MTRKLLALSLWLPLTLAAAPPQKPPKPVHPPVDAEETCDGCHREVTPEVVEAWHASKHGLNNVKCFVCHGSLKENFMQQAPKERCMGCHGEKVESLSLPFFQGKDCFSCHAGHELNPHRLLKGGAQ